MKVEYMKSLITLATTRGFIFQGSEIYGGLANTWDYGPLGVELKNNIKREWWDFFIRSREDMCGLDSSILMHPKVWEASGHVESFTDPLVDCRECKSRFRADTLILNALKDSSESLRESLKDYAELIECDLAGASHEDLNELIRVIDVVCSECGARGKFTGVRQFNLLFQTFQGVVEDKKTALYLRPETAQGIFINFKNVQRVTRRKLPFGIGQIGKAFRNEITPGNFIFRTREFEQMEIEYFVKPGTEMEYFNQWLEDSMQWFLHLGINPKKLRQKEHGASELSHYSNKTTDIEYEFSFGWGELEGIASRTNFDLTQHQHHSQNDLTYHDPYTNEKYVPYVIEPSFGVDRTFLAILDNAFKQESINQNTRTVLDIHPRLAPIKVAIFPLKKNEAPIVQKARQIFGSLKKQYNVIYDDSGSIGKLYRRQDEIGTPFCITVDFETVDGDKKVTIRERNSMKQTRVSCESIQAYFCECF